MDVLPAFPNQFPYYELLFRDRISAKTREWAWKHVGWTLFYTSKSRIARAAAEAHVLKVERYRHTLGCLVGIGYLLPVRENTQKEIRRLEKEFNNGGPVEIFAGAYRYEFRPFYRFSKPIPFTAPRGAVTTFKVPVKTVAKEIERLGIQL